MRIVVSDFMSLDGVVQSPGGQGQDTDGGFAHGGWSMPYFEPKTMGPAVTETMDGTGALLFGRRTWQTMAAAWPTRAGDPFADRMNEIPKYVASRTLTQDDLTWPGSTLLPLGGGAADRARSGRRVPADDRANPARRRQRGVPLRRSGPRARVGVGDDNRD